MLRLLDATKHDDASACMEALVCCSKLPAAQLLVVACVPTQKRPPWCGQVCRDNFDTWLVNLKAALQDDPAALYALELIISGEYVRAYNVRPAFGMVPDLATFEAAYETFSRCDGGCGMLLKYWQEPLQEHEHHTQVNKGSSHMLQGNSNTSHAGT
jgi:hypothetical protein